MAYPLIILPDYGSWADEMEDMPIQCTLYRLWIR